MRVRVRARVCVLLRQAERWRQRRTDGDGDGDRDRDRERGARSQRSGRDEVVMVSMIHRYTAVTSITLQAALANT